MTKNLRSTEITSDHCLIDVRTPHEFAERKIPGSLNVPLGSLSDELEQLSGRENIVLVCAAGTRAEKARSILDKRGVKAQVLEGGIAQWKNATLPLELGEPQGLSLERQVRIVAGTLVAAGSTLALLVDPRYAIASGLIGCGLVFAGVTNTCGLAMLLAKLPYNRRSANPKKCSAGMRLF